MAAMKAGFAYASALLCVVIALAAPAFSQNADVKKQLDEISSAYIESYRKQDAAGIATLYATAGILVTPTGAQTDLAKYYNAAFKMGLNQLEIKLDQAWPFGSDGALGMGTYRAAGKDSSGAPIEVAGLWTGAYVQEAGKLKIRMLTAFPPPAAK
jgi:ketosteroid isomerase-like protein